MWITRELFWPLDRIYIMERFDHLINAELLRRLKELAQRERRATVDFLACLAEVDRRSATLEAGAGSLFTHCVSELHFSAGAAFIRTRAARAANRYPELYSLIHDGLVNITNLSMVYDHLKNHPHLIQAIQGKSRLEVERLVAAIAPKRDRPDTIRVLSSPQSGGSLRLNSPAATSSTEGTPSHSENSGTPLTLSGETSADQNAFPEIPPTVEGAVNQPARLQFSFTAGDDFLDALNKLRGILWHKHPHGRLEDILLEAISEFLERRDPERSRRLIKSRIRNPHSRDIPAAVARHVAVRDGHQCSFVSSAGTRCIETKGLEIDHVTPWARGGRSDDPGNLRLLCRAHNQWAAIQAFGEEKCKPRPKT
jgi:hypothetical protein